ncbi:MAG: hypothetical protein ABIS86_02070, partial [Streptosporangiaceae bacterium]
MSSLRDQMMLELSDPDTFEALLQGEPGQELVQTMLAATYDLSAVRVDRITNVAVSALELQHPLFGTDQVAGNWTQTVPGYTRTELALERARSRDPVWIDVLARLQVTVVTEI